MTITSLLLLTWSDPSFSSSWTSTSGTPPSPLTGSRGHSKTHLHPTAGAPTAMESNIRAPGPPPRFKERTLLRPVWGTSLRAGRSKKRTGVRLLRFLSGDVLFLDANSDVLFLRKEIVISVIT